MPLVKIFHGTYFAENTTEKINQIIHHSLETCFNIPTQDTFNLWVSTNTQTNLIDETYLLERGKRNADFLYIEIFCGPGRSIEQKKQLYQAIATTIQKETAIIKQNIFILLNEVPLENWSFGEGGAQMI